MEVNMDDLKAKLAADIEAYLLKIGPDIQGLSWFSSRAREYNETTGRLQNDGGVP